MQVCFPFLALRSWKLIQHLETYMQDTKREHQKLQQQKADLKKEEEKMRESLQAEVDKTEKELQEKRDEVAAEMKDWEEEKERVKQTKVFDKVITLNVGGTRYTTTLSTLTKYPDSMLGVMFSGRHDLPQQEDGSYFIDRDGEVFKHILMYLRDRNLCLSLFPTFSDTTLIQIKAEFEYFQLHPDVVSSIISTCRIPDYSCQFDIKQSMQAFSTTVKPSPVRVQLEYSGLQFDCEELPYPNRNVIKVNGKFNGRCEEKILKGTVELTNCNLSGACFVKCSFQGPTSFEGCVMLNTVFHQVDGLVSKQVHFTPWQIAQAKFEPNLLRALQEAGCIYD